MSEPRLRVIGLVDINSVTRNGIYDLPEEEARQLIICGFAAPYRDKPPAPTVEEIKGSAGNKPPQRQGKPAKESSGSRLPPSPKDDDDTEGSDPDADKDEADATSKN